MLKRIAAFIGPGVITASLVLGPGSMTVATKVGSLFGYRLLWWLVLLWGFMVAYTSMGAKVGVLSDKTMMTLVANHFSRTAAVVLGISVFFICCSFQTGDVIGVSTALATVFGAGDMVFKILFPILCIALYYSAPNVYKFIERMMLAMVVVMVVAFFGNLIMAGPEIGAAAKGFIPSLPEARHLGLMSAMAATNFVVAAAFYQAYLVKEKGWTKEDYRKGVKDTIVGITILFVLVGVITMTSAAVLMPRNIDVKSAADMAIQLEPLMGVFAKYLFSFGFFAASFSSLAVNALTGATLLADSLNKPCTMQSRWVKGFATAIMLLGLLVSLVIGGTPVKAIIFVQRLTLLSVPALALTMLWASNSNAVVGKEKNRLGTNLLAGLGFAVVVYLFIDLVKTLAATAVHL